MLFVLIQVAAFARAADFGECTRHLLADETLRPYVIEASPTFTREERRLFSRIFSRATKHTLADDGEDVSYLHPFYLNFEVDPDGVITRRIKSVVPEGLRFGRLEATGRRFLARALRTAEADRYLGALSVRPGSPLRVMFFGLRYVLRPGTRRTGLGWHRDSANWQALVVLNRPPGLAGGNTVLGWPADENVPPGQNDDEAVARLREWRPRLRPNRTLVFDGARAVHAVSDFDFRRGEETAYRDIVGLTIE